MCDILSRLRDERTRGLGSLRLRIAINGRRDTPTGLTSKRSGTAGERGRNGAVLAVLLFREEGELFAGSAGLDYTLFQKKFAEARFVPGVKRICFEVGKDRLGAIELLLSPLGGGGVFGICI